MHRAKRPVLSEGRVLVLAPSGRDAVLAIAILGEAGIDGMACASVPDLVSGLGDADTAVVTEEALATADLRELVCWVANQPPWSDFPLVVLTRRGGGPERVPEAARLAEALGNVTFIERPFHPTTLVSAIRGALSARRRQHQARTALEAEALGAERLRRIQRIGRVGGFETDIRTDTNHRSAEYMSIHGLPARETVERHRDWAGRLHPEDRERAERCILDALRDPAVTEYAQEYRIVTPTGEIRWISARAQVERDAVGRAIFMRGAHVNVTELKAAEEALRASEARFRLATEAFQGAVYEYDVAADRTVRSGAFVELIGLQPDEIPASKQGWLDRVHPDDLATLSAAAAGVYEGNESRFEAEYRIRHRDGHWVHCWQRSMALRDASGRLRRVIGSIVDVTERKRSEERRLMLVREVDHRAKNVLAVVQSLVALSDRSDAERFAEAVQGRVAAMAHAHGLLARAQWAGAELRDIAQQEVTAFGGEGRVRLEGPPVRLVSDAVQPLSMVLHELVTNAAKYGALSRADGRVSIVWCVEPDVSGGLLRLLWTERDGPEVTGPPAREGFGSTLLGGMVSGQLGGSFMRRWEPEGLVCEVTIAGDMFEIASTKSHS